MLEQRRDDVLSEAIGVLSALTTTRRCKPLEFHRCDPHRLAMRLNNSHVAVNERGD
jgi:hypothetical protein